MDDRLTRDMPASSVLFRAATLEPASANQEARTVRATISTGAPVKRSLWGEEWVERLDLKNIQPADVVGLAVVDSHNIMTTDAIRGAVVAAGRDNAGLWSDMRIDDDPTWAKIMAGSLRSVSIGYQVDEWVETRTGEGSLIERTAVNWRILEVSLVVIPADSAAKIRSALMPSEQQAAPTSVAAEATSVVVPAVASPPPVTAPAATETRSAPVEVTVTEVQKEVAIVPETRAASAALPVVAPVAAPVDRAAVNVEIRSIARVAGLDQVWIDGQIDASATAEQARALAWDAMSTRAAPVISTVTVLHDNTNPDVIRARMADAVAARFTRTAPPEHAREFMQHSVAELVVDLCNRRGAKLNPRDRIAAVDYLFSRSAAHSTSDFPLLLQDAGNKILLPHYAAAMPTYRLFSAQRTFNDFKSHKFLRLGDFPSLQEIKEAGETTYGTVSENRETVTAKEFGSGLTIGRKALINDDLSAFADFTGMIAVRVAADENALVYTLLATNGPTMSDSVALFDNTAHGNKASSATTIDVANYAIAVAAMRNQTSLDGVKLNVTPRYLVVGTAKEVAAKQLLTAIVPNDTAKVNPWAGNSELIVDANNAGNRWMIFADPAMLPTVVYGYVNGATGPQIRSEIDFDTRALKVAVGLDFACGVIDYRGAFLNAGA